MKFFRKDGDTSALRLEFQGFKQCDCCERKAHILYYFHRRLVCYKHLPVECVVVTRERFIRYVLTKIEVTNGQGE